MTDDELEARLGEVLRPAQVDPPAARVAALRARVMQLRGDLGAPEPAPGRLRPAARPASLALAAGVALLVVGAAVGRLTAPDGGADDDLLSRGTPEFTARVADGPVTVELEGARAPEGRVVVLRSSSLPVLPRGDYYELWFVGPRDAPGSPDRVSAGTFHPDYDDGTTLVVLHAAIDPGLFTGLEITTETDDGNPAPSADVVLTGSVEPVAGP